MTAAFCAAVLWSQAAVGAPGHHGKRPQCCDVCGVESAEVLAEIQILQGCPRWRKRDNAAHRLRRFDWRCHPDAVNALVTALLTDSEEEVREEAAQSLRKMAPCLPGVHEALDRAARCDPDHSTRKWARKALAALGRRCVGGCVLCTSAAGGTSEPLLIAPGDSIVVTPRAPAAPEPSLLPAPVERGLDVTPPSELPPAELPPLAPPAAGPFEDRAPWAARSANHLADRPAPRSRPGLFGLARRLRPLGPREKSAALESTAANRARIVGDPVGESTEALHDRSR
jgi:hypothetical protein